MQQHTFLTQPPGAPGKGVKGQISFNFNYKCNFKDFKGALAWYGKLTWESAHAWILKILCYLIVWGITLIFMVRLRFYAIPSLIYDVINDITIITLGTQL